MGIKFLIEIDDRGERGNGFLVSDTIVSMRLLIVSMNSALIDFPVPRCVGRFT